MRPSEHADALLLPATATSPRVARHHVRDRLRRAGHPEWSEAAELAVSEVVTNGLLHAHTDLRLRVEVGHDHALVEVADGSSVLPLQRHGSDAEHGGEGTTGRGLALLAAITLERGVRATQEGKVVWFTVGAEAELPPGDPLAGSDDADWHLDAPPVPEHGERVLLRGFPATLWLAAREHHQALLRELVLYLAEHGDELDSVPDLAQADAARTLLWTSLLSALDARDARAGAQDGRPSREGHPEPLDLPLVVPPGTGAAFGAFQDALDTAERLAARDLLLVRPGLPEIVAVRDWACEQVVAQLAGVPAAPWPGAERFAGAVRDRSDADRTGFDSSWVTRSPRGVVAADEANRILAVSRPVAELTGWDPDDLVGRRVIALVPPALREEHVAGFSRHLTTGEGRLLGVPLALPVLHADGRELPCTVRLEHRPTSGRPVYLAWIEPLTT